MSESRMEFHLCNRNCGNNFARFPYYFLKTPTCGRSHQCCQRHTSMGFWLWPRMDNGNTQRWRQSSSFYRQSLPWVILTPCNCSVVFGGSTTIHHFFWCPISQAHDAGQVQNYRNYKSRAYTCLVNIWKSWQMFEAPTRRHMEAWLGNIMLILWYYGSVSLVAPGQDWPANNCSPSRQERAVVAHTLTHLSLLQALWLEQDMAYLHIINRSLWSIYLVF